MTTAATPRYFSVRLFGCCLLALTAALFVAPESFGWIGRLWPSCAILFCAAVLVSLLRRLVHSPPLRALRADGAIGFSVLLPCAQRRDWIAERAAVLHACADRAERRRQAIGFTLSLPRTIVTAWTARR